MARTSRVNGANAGTGYFQGTDTPTFYALNPAGMMTGWYIDGNNTYHGWAR
jgi:hypothetical protein